MVVRVLCLTDYFLPGFKAGGPIRTLCNMADMLEGSVHFNYLTRNHDLGQDQPYENIKSDQWAEYPHGEVFYASESAYGLRAFLEALNARKFDIIYLNSFFSLQSSIKILLYNRIKPLSQPILLAPRGEFSPGALSLKSPKKRAFLAIAGQMRLYRNIWWHASTEREAEDILALFPEAASRIFIAEDPVAMAQDDSAIETNKEAGEVRLVFVSRISPMKNLEGLLAILSGVSCRVRLRIYGPIEHKSYWRKCSEIIKNMKENISVQYCGELHPDEVSTKFSEGDLFAFPTLGENFGHVIFESLRAGTPVLLSDQTPWQSDGGGAVTLLRLTDIGGWREQIEKVARLTNSQQRQRRAETLHYAKRHAMAEKTHSDNIRMFQEIARHNIIKASSL